MAYANSGNQKKSGLKMITSLTEPQKNEKVWFSAFVDAEKAHRAIEDAARESDKEGQIKIMILAPRSGDVGPGLFAAGVSLVNRNQSSQQRPQSGYQRSNQRQQQPPVTDNQENDEEEIF